MQCSGRSATSNIDCCIFIVQVHQFRKQLLKWPNTTVRLHIKEAVADFTSIRLGKLDVIFLLQNVKLEVVLKKPRKLILLSVLIYAETICD